MSKKIKIMVAAFALIMFGFTAQAADPVLIGYSIDKTG